jgi:uncharacterized membrane protein YsdA (DUF1294 family)
MIKPTTLYFFLSSSLIFLVFLTLFSVKLKLQLPIAYLVAINLTLFLLYFYDKTTAKLSWLRVPEVILHLFALLGASPMAFFAQKLFSHKTTKANFQSTFKKIVAVQALIALGIAGSIFYFA